jgi:adenylate cyclase
MSDSRRGGKGDRMLRERISRILGTSRARKLFARVQRALNYGTGSYPPRIRRRLKIMNVTAYVVAAFTLIYAVQQMFLDFQTWKPVIFINVAMGVLALSIPFLHRFGELTGPIAITLSELFGIFAITYYVGNDAGLHLQYFAATAAYFVILGLERLKLIVAFVLLALALHLAAWSWFVQSRAILAVSQVELNEHYVTAVVTTFTIVSVVVYYAFRLVEQAQAETDALLHNILPTSIADRLKDAPNTTIADEVSEASVLFADLKGFVALAKQMGPARTVALLNTIVIAFDKLAERCGVEKIKTIGDAYMVASGLPLPAADHAERMADMAFGMLETVKRISGEQNVTLSLRIGVASGPLLAGVIGAKRLTYDIWGDTVNLASRLEGRSEPNRILVSRLTRVLVENRFELEPAGSVDIRGIGAEEAWYLVAPRRQTEGAPALLSAARVQGID